MGPNAKWLGPGGIQGAGDECERFQQSVTWDAAHQSTRGLGILLYSSTVSLSLQSWHGPDSHRCNLMG